MIVGSFTLKSSVLSLSSYVTEIPDSVLEPTIAPTVSAIDSDKVIPAIVKASVSNVPLTSTLPSISKLLAVTAPVTVILSTKASLNLTAVVPKSTSLSIPAWNTPSINFTWSAPPALNIMLLSVAKSISLSASLPTTKAALVRDVTVVCVVPNTKSNVLSLSSYVTAIPVSALPPTIAPTVSDIVSARVTPLTVIASASNIPSTSTLAENSTVGAVTFKLPVPVSAIYECVPSW